MTDREREDREQRAMSYSDELRNSYQAYLETCEREGLTPGYGDIVDWAEGDGPVARMPETEIDDTYPF